MQTASDREIRTRRTKAKIDEPGVIRMEYWNGHGMNDMNMVAGRSET